MGPTRGFPILPLLALVVAPLGVNLLQVPLSRSREAEADLEAARTDRRPLGLASALAKMRSQEQMRPPRSGTIRRASCRALAPPNASRRGPATPAEGRRPARAEANRRRRPSRQKPSRKTSVARQFSGCESGRL
jgi:heat shock protein HtpX